MYTNLKLNRDHLYRIGAVALIPLGLATRVWAASRWSENFDSDEAIFGLMSLHMKGGEFVPTIYGTHNLGSIESIVGATLTKWLGVDVFVLRLSALLMIGAFLAVHVWYVWRTWGRAPALMSAAFLALPGFHILSWTYQTIGAYAALLMLGTTFLLVGVTHPSTERTRLMKALLLGFLAGLGFWSNQMMVVYVVAVVLPALLSSQEWGKLRDRFRSFIKQRIGLPESELMLVMVMGLMGIGILAFFSGACEPTWQFARAEGIARAILVLIAGSSLLAFFVMSSKRANLLARSAGATVGFLLGFSPLWISWLAGIEKPVSVIRRSCLTGIINRSQLLGEQILPELAGVRTVRQLPSLGLGEQAMWIGIVCIAILATITFLWRNRHNLWAVLSLRPIQGEDAQRVVTLFVLFAGPLLLSLLGNNTADLHSIRHLIVSWQAMAIISGVYLYRVMQNRRLLGTLLFVGWAGYVGLSNLRYANQNWPRKFTAFDKEAISELEGYLEREADGKGYADYWGAYAIDFLSEEAIILAPYNGVNRFPSYTAEVEAAVRKAFIFPIERSPEGELTIDTLRSFLGQENLVSGEGPASAGILDGLDGAQVESRGQVAHWEVWVVAP
jgi:hypothetical protein